MTSSAETKRFGAALKARRKKLRITQAQLALLADCSTLFISELERGKPSVQLDKVLAVLKVLGLQFTLEPGRNGIQVSD